MALYLAVVVQLRDHGASVRAIGLAMAGQAVGTLLGAGLVGPLHRRFAPGALLLAACALMTASVALMAAPFGPWWIFGWLSVAMLGVPAVSVLIDVLILRQVPDERRGRTMAAMMTVMTIGMPVGTLAGGLLLQLFGPIVTILVIALVCAAGCVLGVSDRDLRDAQWPATALG
jgi:MFS family permease